MGYTVSRSSFRNKGGFDRAIDRTLYTYVGLLNGSCLRIGDGTIGDDSNYFVCSVVAVGCLQTLTAVRVKAAISIRGRLTVVKAEKHVAMPNS